MHLLLVRHALPLRSEGAEGSDPSLSDLGMEMAQRLPGALQRHVVTKVVSSPQLRARQTAQPLADSLGLPVEIYEDLAEYDYGLSEYVPVEQVRVENPIQLAKLLDGQLPDGVDVEAFKSRVIGAARRLAAAASRDDTVAVFTHGGVINVLLHHALGTSKLFPFRIDYVSVSDLRYSSDGSPIVVGVNNFEHVWDMLPRLQRR